MKKTTKTYTTQIRKGIMKTVRHRIRSLNLLNLFCQDGVWLFVDVEEAGSAESLCRFSDPFVAHYSIK